MFSHNTVIGLSISYGFVGTAFGKQGTYNSVTQDHNEYFTPNVSSMPFNACGKSFAQLQAAGYEVGSTISADITVDQIMGRARVLLGL